jgi:hypothetical protein
VAGNAEPVIEVMAPGDDAARWVLRAYFDEVASRYYGRPATGDHGRYVDHSFEKALP